MLSSSTVLSKMIMRENSDQFTSIQAAGFPVQDLLRLVSAWPRVPSEFKLQVVADSLFSHYRENPSFGETLSQLLNALKETEKNSATYRLWKIMGSWLHQQWTSLPCAKLSSNEAYRLFPEHALAPPLIHPPIKPFQAEKYGFKYLGKVLYRPLEWEGALDSFSRLLNAIPQPKRMSVIGFGDGKELIELHKKWPSTIIHGFEHSERDEYKRQLELIASEPNVEIHYNARPESYKHGTDLIDFALIRHPNALGNKGWVYVVLKTMESLTTDGTLLINFYSKKEMRYLKAALMEIAGSKYSWSEKVNPYAFNPAFMSKSGTYSFDLILVTVRSKLSNQPCLLDHFTIEKTRKQEESNLEICASQKKFEVIEHERVHVVTQQGFYKDHHQKLENAESQCCFKCRELTSDFYNAVTHVGGKSNVLANVQFCEEHVPANKDAWENMLKEPWSAWSTKEPKVYKLSLVGRGFEKSRNNDSISSMELPIKRSKM